MKNNWMIAILLILGLIAGILVGVFVFGQDDTIEGNITSTEKLASENIAVGNDILNVTVETSSMENTKISPNAIIIEKTYYKSCDHLLREVIDIPEELVNKTEEDIKNAYKGWQVEGFSPTEIVLYKEMPGMCGEHYLVKEHNGVIGIYTLDEYGQAEFKEDTEIITQYLPGEDLAELTEGVTLVGETSLYNFLENFE